MPEYISIIHVAAPPENGVQLCFHCDVELASEPLMMWTIGHKIGQGIRTSDRKPTGGWGDMDDPHCRGVEPEDEACTQRER